MIKYISPTSLAQWETNREEFYLQRLCPTRPPRMPQTKPMAAGAAFDAYVKHFLREKLLGIKEPLEETFNRQVEADLRPWALEHGKKLFDFYLASGALGDLMLELKLATEKPRFEFEVENNVFHSCCPDGIPLLGKPDVYYTVGQRHVILDWKVNGYCSETCPSPAKGYLKIRPSGKAHKICMPIMKDGIIINASFHLEDVNKAWATQLTLYAWTLGVEVGETFIGGVDQLIGHAEKVATFRHTVSLDFQLALIERLRNMWEAITSNWIFTELTPQASIDKCEALDRMYLCEDKKDEWFASIRGK